MRVHSLLCTNESVPVVSPIEVENIPLVEHGVRVIKAMGSGQPFPRGSREAITKAAFEQGARHFAKTNVSLLGGAPGATITTVFNEKWRQRSSGDNEKLFGQINGDLNDLTRAYTSIRSNRTEKERMEVAGLLVLFKKAVGAKDIPEGCLKIDYSESLKALQNVRFSADSFCFCQPVERPREVAPGAEEPSIVEPVGDFLGCTAVQPDTPVNRPCIIQQPENKFVGFEAISPAPVDSHRHRLGDEEVEASPAKRRRAGYKDDEPSFEEVNEKTQPLGPPTNALSLNQEWVDDFVGFDSELGEGLSLGYAESSGANRETFESVSNLFDQGWSLDASIYAQELLSKLSLLAHGGSVCPSSQLGDEWEWTVLD